jgi:alkyl sulfatase BDS1-like metallo-beta-lactamase superfamily hydrolase
LIDRGYKPAEIAETLALPASLASDLVTCVATTGRSPNARAIDQRDIGWYDAG